MNSYWIPKGAAIANIIFPWHCIPAGMEFQSVLFFLCCSSGFFVVVVLFCYIFMKETTKRLLRDIKRIAQETKKWPGRKGTKWNVRLILKHNIPDKEMWPNLRSWAEQAWGVVEDKFVLREGILNKWVEFNTRPSLSPEKAGLYKIQIPPALATLALWGYSLCV